MGLQIEIAAHDRERGQIFGRALLVRGEVLEERNQWRERGAQLVRKHPEEKFFGGHGGLGQDLLELELLLDLAALREVGERDIEIRPIRLAAADHALHAHKSLVASGAAEEQLAHFHFSRRARGFEMLFEDGERVRRDMGEEGARAAVKQRAIHVEHLRPEDVGFENQAGVVQPDQADGRQIEVAEIFLLRFFDLRAAVEQLFVLNLQLGIVNVQLGHGGAQISYTRRLAGGWHGAQALLGAAAQGRVGGEFQRGGFHVRSLSVCACFN